jgi:hypothetical protein
MRQNNCREYEVFDRKAMRWILPTYRHRCATIQVYRLHPKTEGESRMNIIIRIGIDLAKQVFQLYGVNSHEKVVAQTA